MSNTNELKDSIDNKIEQLLKNVAEEESFKDYKIVKATGSLKGDGYMGLITAIDIIGKTTSGEEKALHLIVKSASKSDAVRVEMQLASIYDREIYMYDVIIPAFQIFLKEKGLPPFSSSARCYKACMIEKSEALILENLKTNGYSIWERSIPMEDDHVGLVMAQYGQFHALSFALKDQEPERFANLTVDMYDIFVDFMERKDFVKMFEERCRKALEALDPVKEKVAQTTFKKFIDEELRNLFLNLNKLVDQYSVILHGDGWTNNMLFKYEDKNNSKKPTKMCLIDLQVSRLGPPVLDLSYFIYACSSKNVLDNLDHYLDIYHNSLSDYLRRLGSDPEKVYPYSVLRDQWKELSRFGLVCSMLLIHVMLSEQNEVADFTEIAESGKSVTEAFNYNLSNSEIYNDRARHVILHFINKGFL